MAMLNNQRVTLRTLGLAMGRLATKQQLKNREKDGCRFRAENSTSWECHPTWQDRSCSMTQV